MTNSSVQVQEFMSTKPIHINEDDNLHFIMNIFERTHISGAPVVNAKGEYVGVVTKTDLTGTRLLKLLSRIDQVTAKEVMSPGKPFTVKRETPLEQAVTLMLDNHFHRLFVEDGQGQIIGVLSTFDILRAIKRTDDKPAVVKPVAAEKPAEVVKEKPAVTAKDIERRIFTLVSQKQGEIM